MNKITIIVIASFVVLAALIVLLAYSNGVRLQSGARSSAMSLNSFFVTSTKVDQGNITIEIGSAVSTLPFDGKYDAEYKDGSLYVSLLVGGLNDHAPMKISIPNTYGHIDAIYVRGTPTESPQQIWPDILTSQLR